MSSNGGISTLSKLYRSSLTFHFRSLFALLTFHFRAENEILTFQIRALFIYNLHYWMYEVQEKGDGCSQAVDEFLRSNNLMAVVYIPMYMAMFLDDGSMARARD